MTVAFTEKEIENWRAYEKVRASGEWNMFDVNAREATGMTRGEYWFTMRNYIALKRANKKHDSI
jgi:hypothetical protein